jgi:hypothetical protein
LTHEARARTADNADRRSSSSTFKAFEATNFVERTSNYIVPYHVGSGSITGKIKQEPR